MHVARGTIPLPARSGSPALTSRGIVGGVTLATVIAVAASGLLAEPAIAAPEASAAQESLVDLVNPLIGTLDDGNTYPGASVPFGMVQLSPDNGHSTGYDYNRSRIRGFSLVHLSGVGCPLGGALPILPTTGPVTQTDNSHYELAYSHDDELASPGYYSVDLSSAAGPITAELTATEHTGVQRYTFPSTTEANVLINAGQALNRVSSSEIRVVDSRTVVAHVVARGFCQDTEPVDFYTRTVFDRDITSFGTWTGDTITDAPAASGTDRVGAYVRFDTTDGDRDVESVTSLSYVDEPGALANLDAERAGFDDAHAAAVSLWESRLGSVQAAGGSLDERRVFYSALYRSFLAPNTGTDVDGRYRGWDQSIHVADGFVYYQNFSLWDTYRTQQQLLALLAPRESSDMALSVVRAAEQGGWLPRWGFSTVETNVMTGDPATVFLVSAWSQGLLAGHEDEAYAVLTQNADGVPPADSPANGRAGNDSYLTNGFVPHEPSIPGKPGDFDLDHGGSATLEYAVSDAALSTMAAGLGHADAAARYAARGEYYRSVFDPRTDNFRARNAAGAFIGSDDPAKADGFHEGTAVQYRWLVPQDMDGLVNLLGGKQLASASLDDFFAYDQLLADPKGTARDVWVNGTYDYYNQDKYNPNNEPDLHSPYAYLWTGEPWKTTDVVSAAMTLFTDRPNGVTGNDDLGTMSAWYVLSALGIYPIVPGTDVWGLNTPAFDEAVVTLDNDFYGQDRLIISAPGRSASNRYIQSVSVGGTDVERGYLSGRELAAAGTVVISTGTAPSTWATGAGAAPASLTTPGTSPDRVFVSVPSGAHFVTPGGTVELAVDIVAQGDGVRTGTVSAIGGGSVTVDGGSSEWSAQSNGLPTTVSTAVTLKAAANATTGRHPVQLSVSDEGGANVTWSGSVVVAEPSPLDGALDNVGIGDLGAANADFDQQGNFLARDGLDAAGVTQGVPATVPGTNLRYSLATAPTGSADNVRTNGQPISLPDWWTSSTAISLVGASANGNHGGTLTLRFDDGSTSTVPVELADWCSGTTPPAPMISVASTPRRGEGAGSGGSGCGLYSTAPIPIPAGKALIGVVLPTSPQMHVFAIASDATRPAPIYEPTVTVRSVTVPRGAPSENVAYGRGFVPNAPITAVLASQPTELPGGIADADGSIDIAFATSQLEAGSHTVTLTQERDGEESLTAVATFTVTSSTTPDPGETPGGETPGGQNPGGAPSGTGAGDTASAPGTSSSALAVSGADVFPAVAFLALLLAGGLFLRSLGRRRTR